MKKYAIWFYPTSEWVVNNSGVVLTFDTFDDAEKYRMIIDVAPPLHPNMEVKIYDLQD